MIGEKITYRLSERAFKRVVAIWMRIGTVMHVPGRTVKITHFGQRYKGGRKWWVDVEAVEIEETEEDEV